MTIFELVKLALDDLYDEGCQQYGGQIDSKIKERMAYLSECYRHLSLSDRSPINYKDPATRFAYTYTHVAAHGDYIVQALKELRANLDEPIFTNSTLRLTCVGGGPGSDVVGVLKYLADYRKHENVEKLTCYLLDGEQAWADTWPELGEKINSDVSINVHFQKLDVNEPDSWSAQKKFLKANLFTLSYFVSEVQSLDKGTITEFWQKLFDEAISGAIFLYVDNGSHIFNAYFDKQWASRGDMKCLIKTDNVARTPSHSEQKSELADYEQKFGKSPKLKATISLRVLRKN
jgi:hypothetical protein